jgi:hypothetical protein
VEVLATGELWGWRQNLSHDDGSFVIEGLRPGSYRVTASRQLWGEELRNPGNGDDDVQGTRVNVRAGAATPVKLVVERLAGRITGTVSRGGAPVTDAFVDAERESESAATAEGDVRRRIRWGWTRQPVLTDADGRFTLSRLAPGKYLVRAFRKGGGEAVAEHVAVGTAVALVIRPTGVLSGTVALAGQPPPERFRVRVLDHEQGIEVGESFWRTGGTWALHELPAGHFEIHATAREGEGRAEASLAEGQSQDGIRLTLSPRATLRGQVVALDTGKPLPSMRVTARLPSGSGVIFFQSDSGGERKNITDAEGRFQLDDAPVGRVVISVMPVQIDDSDYDRCLGRASVQAGQALDLPPIRRARRRVKTMRDLGGDLGFTLKEINEAEAGEPIPLVVAVVRPGGPAAAAGLKVKDVITSIDGVDVTGPNDYLFWTLSRVPEATTVAVGLAGGKTVSITAGPHP